MKNLKFLFVLISILYVGINFMACEDEVADPPIEGVTAMKQNTSNPAVWSAEVDVLQLKKDFKNGNTARLSIPSGSSFSSCIKLVKEKNDCILAATGNWENTGETDNPLGDVECCREYYNRQLLESNCLVTANFLDPVIEGLQEQLVKGEVGKTTAINLDFSEYPTAVENVNVGFLVHEDKHYIATSFEEKNGEGEAVQMTLMRSLNAATSETFATPNARFANQSTGGGGNGNLIIGGGTVEYVLDIPFNPGLFDGVPTIANCGGQAGGRPPVRTGSGGQRLASGSCTFPVGCENCITYGGDSLAVDVFMHIGYPIVTPKNNPYDNHQIDTKIYSFDITNHSSFFDKTKIDSNNYSVITSNSSITNQSPKVPITIEDELFKPYLKADINGICSNPLEIFVNRFVIPLKFKVNSNIFQDTSNIMLVSLQILDSATNNLLGVKPENGTTASDHDLLTSPPVLENEVLIIFSKDTSQVRFIDDVPIPNIYVCQLEIDID